MIQTHHDALRHALRQHVIRLQELDEQLVHHQLLAQDGGSSPECPDIPLQHATLQHLPPDIKTSQNFNPTGGKEVAPPQKKNINTAIHVSAKRSVNDTFKVMSSAKRNRINANK